MFQHFHPADIQGLALDYVGFCQCEIPGADFSGASFLGNSLRFNAFNFWTCRTVFMTTGAEYRNLDFGSIFLSNGVLRKQGQWQGNVWQKEKTRLFFPFLCQTFPCQNVLGNA